MINVMHSMDRPLNQLEKSLDPQLWHACAGGMAQIPPLNSQVYYFPQGHAEHSNNSNINFNKLPQISPIIPCKVSSIKYLADSETDEVYAKIRLVPLRPNECDSDDENGFSGLDKTGDKEKSNSFAKTLTQSDANNGGGFSVPRYCAETIFPRLDYSADPPVQTILVRDVHGEVWKFRHIYRGTPRRHLLTTGWSNFVNSKKLVAGDSIVFLRAENGDLCIGLRRAKLGIGPSGYFSGLSGGSGKNGDCFESVVEAASLAVSGQAFEAVYYPRASAPEFVVRASAVRAAMRVRWCSGIRFKMAFETEDSSRISWFMGTISSVQVDDPIRWPNSPWRILEVLWDEPDLLQNVKRVNPWLVELVSNIPTIHLSPFAPPRKRQRQQYSDFPVGPQLPMPTLISNNPLSPSSPLCCFPSDNTVFSGVQGARHAELVLSSSNLRFNNLPTGLLRPFDFKPLGYAGPLPQIGISNLFESCSNLKKVNNESKAPVFVLFGQPILTEKQISESCSDGSGSAVIQNCFPEGSSDEEFPRCGDRCKGLENELRTV
ncbi:hypothetical protein CASFOL_006420 [Castilleja foliolosa]|uniref:Auxin response factor n=1 Tax=Castilleja foliolosa TaxID=1961234 RepID=A0ABD3E8D2_9LAMI